MTLTYQGKFTSANYNEEQNHTIKKLHQSIDQLNALEKMIAMQNIIQEGKHAYNAMHVLNEWSIFKQKANHHRIVVPANEKHVIGHTAIQASIGLPLALMPMSNSVWCPILDQSAVFDENNESSNNRYAIDVKSNFESNKTFENDPHYACGKKTNGHAFPFVQVFDFPSSQTFEAVELTWTISFLNRNQFITQANALYIQPFAMGFHAVESIRIMENNTWIEIKVNESLKEGMADWIHLPRMTIQKMEIKIKCHVSIIANDRKMVWLGFEKIGLYQMEFASEGKTGLRFHLPNIEGIKQIREIHADHEMGFDLFRKTEVGYEKVESSNWQNSFEASEWAIMVHSHVQDANEFAFKGVYLDVIDPMEG